MSTIEEINSERFLSIKELAERLGMTQKGIRDLIHRHKLPASKIGKSYRIRESDFISFWRENQAGR